MAYQVLARKYRPQRFSDVAGQDHVTRTLLNALAQGRIAHGYIFSGHRGIGKTTIARILAMALNCRTEIGSAQRSTPEPCGICESCSEVRAGNAVDVIEIDAATNRGIDEIRELRDAARYRPARDRYKIYILDEAHQITDAAFNALLKTLEEPPDHVVFMMATTQPEDIPQTIRSRCQHFSFHAVKFDDILIQLRTIAVEEKITADDEALALLAEAGDGSMRDALSIMDQAIASAPLIEGMPKLDASQIRELMGSVPNTVFERLLEAIGENQSAPVVEEINRLLNAGNSASQLARQFVRYLRNALMARIAGEQTELLQLSPDERARAGRSALLFSEEDLTRFLGVMLRTFDELNYRQEPRFHLELGVLKLVHLQRLLPVEQLLSQMGGTPTRLGGSALPGAGSSPSPQRSAPPTQAAPAPSAPGRSQVFTPPASVPEARGAASATAGEPAAASHSVFSPFEADSRRKGGEAAKPGTDNGADTNGFAASAAPAQALRPASTLAGRDSSAASLGPAPAEDKTRLATADVSPSLSELETSAGEPEAPDDGLAADRAPTLLSLSAATDAADVIAEPAASVTVTDLDSIRQQVCSALDQAGHNTAAALLGNGAWSEQGESLLVQVAAKKTMLGLTMNPEAERICRETLRAAANGGKPRALSVVPGDGGATRAAARPATNQPGPTGSVQARAMENPLVRQAQELFHAEVRSVVDLRNK